MISCQPLVSILVPNYNHSRYLEECVASALNQTYLNLEVVVLDNASEDNSVNTVKKYMNDARLRICRNCRNLQNHSYLILDHLTNGKYKMILCADDYIEESFVEKAVTVMEEHPNVGYVHVERDFVTDTGKQLELDFFFNCSFIAPGHDTMPLYMVTTVAHPSQGIFRTQTFSQIGGYDMEIDHLNADRMLWFYLSYEADYAYIREKLCKIRIGEQTETRVTQQNFQHPILCHLTLKEMIRFAKAHNLPKVYEREREASHRLAKDFLNYAAEMLLLGEKKPAQRYLNYAVLIAETIIEEEYYSRLKSMIMGKEKYERNYLKEITKSALQKKRNYNPPINYKRLLWRK